ncbi:hypothetical protein CR203_12855 [Salipaludibacillus neizhouensis]|uniref:Radical SAM protein n=1 Tax=Salipaludibacillus neizhouensis TaxID=885475 RepID=A0A3A9K0U6_9BACI|nr:hypothetical protein [Salipaludibacillus neizhouensis]RKL66724.1 hypothetical protein CR203_12855 [Salipaludibacillus neizhouensis]
MNVEFTFNTRLGINLPDLNKKWEDLDITAQGDILAKWEQYRGNIPDRIKDIEMQINDLQDQLYRESNFTRSCELNSDIAELASIINDLWIWYRTGDEVQVSHF